MLFVCVFVVNAGCCVRLMLFVCVLCLFAGVCFCV